MSKKKRSKKALTLYSLFGKIGDFMFFPIMIIAMFSCLSLFSVGKTKPVSIASFSLVKIKSGSMVEMGFGIGDTVITKKTDRSHIDLGDIIAFYNFHDSLDSGTEKFVVVEYNYSVGKEIDMSDENINPSGNTKTPDFTGINKVKRENEKNLSYVEELGIAVYFHQVIGIYTDGWGNVFYKTKGTHNGSADSGLVREEFVVGEYVNTPRAVRDVFNFCATGLGMILFVCIPLSVLVLMDCFSLIEQIEIIKYEKSIVDGDVKLTDSDFKKNFDPNEMELYNKVYVYFKTPPQEREKVKQMLWRELFDPEIELTIKEKEELELLNTSIGKLQQSPDEYWKVWLLGTKGGTNKRIQKLYNSLEYEKLYNKIVHN